MTPLGGGVYGVEKGGDRKPSNGDFVELEILVIRHDGSYEDGCRKLPVAVCQVIIGDEDEFTIIDDYNKFIITIDDGWVFVENPENGARALQIYHTVSSSDLCRI